MQTTSLALTAAALFALSAPSPSLALAPGTCVPAATTLCLDDQSGDRRFRVEVDWSTSQGGAQTGSAFALPTTALGVPRGGLFWFFSQDNPEMLVKVLNGCGVNNAYWFFAAAGTNVGLSIRVTDTSAGTTKTYANADLTAAAPVQDVNAFTCGIPPSPIWADNFESYAVGQFPGAWTLPYSGAGSSQQYVDSARSVSPSRSLHLVGSSCWSADAYHPVTLPSRFRARVHVFMAQLGPCGCDSSLAAFAAWNPDQGSWGTGFGHVFLGCDGQIWAKKKAQDESANVAVAAFTAGRWYQLDLAVDLNARRFDVLVDGIVKATALPILDSGTPKGILLQADHGSNPTVWFDDVEIWPNP